ncbi:unnamed protein product, partial [marine sediment metagenome]
MLCLINRKPNPALFEVKKVYQNIKVHPINLIEGRVLIHNKFDFITLEDIKINWELTANGTIIQNGSVDNLEIESGEQKEAIIQFQKPNLESNTEYHLKFISSLKNSVLWAEKGHILAWDQFKVPYSTVKESNKLEDFPELVIDDLKETYEISGDDFKIRIGKTSGVL